MDAPRVADRPCSILVVEDHADSRQATSRLLQLSGFEVYAADGCEAALRLAAERRIDLLLCDVGLWDGDGCELFKQLRAMYRLDGIAYTGHGTPADVQRSLGAGFASHLIKPVTFDRLLAEIRAVLARRSP